jgi:hypothetical protein
MMKDPDTARGPEDTVVDSIHVQPAKTLKMVWNLQLTSTQLL